MPETSQLRQIRRENYPVIQPYDVGMTIDISQSPLWDTSVLSERILFKIDQERRFAAECDLSLRDWLNLYEFDLADFPASDLDPDPVLVVGIVVLGLRQGFSFEFLTKNIHTLCYEDAAASRMSTEQIEDSLILKNIRLSTIYSRPAIEHQKQATIAVLALIKTKPLLNDETTESAIFSGLLSFVNDKKVLIDSQAISRLRSGSDVQNVYATLFNESNSHANQQRDLASFSISSDGILADRDPERVFERANQLAARINGFLQINIRDNVYRNEFLPTKEERDRAVELFLHDGSELKRLFSGAFKVLSSGFEGKLLKGFHDHDQRHLLFAVPATGVMLLNSFSEYEKIFGSVCAIFHDAGRLVESVFDYSDPRRKQLAKIHPQVSAAIAADYLEAFPELPLAVRNEVIVAVAMHDSGGLHFPLLDVLQSLDRLQLIGPEYLIRGLGYISALQDKEILMPNDRAVMKYGSSLAECVSFYLHHLYPNLSGNSQLESRLAIASGTFLAFASGRAGNYGSYFESSVWPRSNWKCLPYNLTLAIERSIKRWLNGRSHEWPSIDATGRASRTAVDYARDLVTFPLVSDVDRFQINGRSLWDRLERRVLEAERLNDHLCLGFEYASKVAYAHQNEMLTTLRNARNGLDTVWRVLSQEISLATNMY